MEKEAWVLSKLRRKATSILSYCMVDCKASVNVVWVILQFIVSLHTGQSIVFHTEKMSSCAQVQNWFSSQFPTTEYFYMQFIKK